MKIPLISVITPTFNASATIEKALESIACQHFKDIEHLIIDGNSQDNTVEIVHSFQKKYSHIRLICEKDEGIYEAINKGIDMSDGKWLYILGADDVLYHEHVLSDLFDNGIFEMENVVYGNVKVSGESAMSSDGAIYDGPFDLSKLLKKNICQQSILYPRSTIKKNGYFTTRYKTCADWDYNLRCWASQDFFYIDKIIAVYSSGGKSVTEPDGEFSDDLLKNTVSYFHLDPGDDTLNEKNSPFFKVISRYLTKYKDVTEVPIDFKVERIGLNKISLDEDTDPMNQKKNALKELHDRVKYDEILIAFSSRQINNLNARLADLLKVSSSQANTIKNLQGEIRKIYHSLTWRLGKIIMAPVQFVCRLMK